MMKTVKLLTVVAASLLLANCSTKTYQIKSEDGKTLNTVPSWYMANYNESKACDLKVFNSKDCLLYTSPSPRDRQKSRMPSSA